MRRVVRGFWGPREEPVEALAGRWKRTLDQLAGLLPAAAGKPGAGRDEAWTWLQVSSSGPATEIRPDEETLRAALRAAAASENWSDGAGLRLVTGGERGWKIEVSGRAGAVSEFLLQSMVIGVDSPDDADIPDLGLLAVVAEAWEPDFGGVTDDDVLDALEDDGGFAPDEPSVGWAGCLSPARAALVPDDLPALREALRGGGVLLGIASPGDTEEVLRANLRLRDTGALRPLARPMDRATL
jgi:hypothetical protein